MLSEQYKNPKPTVDVIVEMPGGGIVLIERRNEPHGWALPGGFVDEGEPVELAAVREVREETGLEVELDELLYVYSDPRRDPRIHTVSTVFIAHPTRADAQPAAGDDAKGIGVYPADAPPPLVFDHPLILRDYLAFRRTGTRPKPSVALERWRTKSPL